MKRMLFNATHPEELRLAVVDGQKLLDLDIESAAYQNRKGNIYKGRVTRVEPSLEAAFVDYGTERQGFLPLKEISRIYFTGNNDAPIAQVRIQDVIKEGQELIVQVDKEERGSKGAALTTFVSLAGRFLVLMPNNPKGGGISRRIEGEERAELREAMAQLEVPDDYALIARTAGIGKSVDELQWDLDYLIHLWDAISKASVERSSPFLIYQEGNLVVRAIRDYLRADIGEIMIDNPEIYERMHKFMEQVAKHNVHKLKLYQEETPMFNRFQIENQIDSAFSREVNLDSGGSLAFDRTEALTSIDVNSARATKGADIEETALNTNLEAADEIARQLRIRDLGGLVVIDFIDMGPTRNQREVENRFNEALKVDRARVQVGRISRFGLLEMSRQRLRPSLGEASSLVCPRCNGNGHIRSVPSSALSILRMVQEEAMKENTAAVHVHLPIETATFLLNEKRREINVLESRIGTPILIIPSADLETPHFKIRRLRTEEYESEADVPSYKTEIQQEIAEESPSYMAQPTVEKPAVGQLTHTTSAPVTSKPSGGWLKKLIAWFSSDDKKSRKAASKRRGPQRRKSHGQGQGQGQARRRGGGQQRGKQSQTRKNQPQQKAKDTDNKPTSQSDNRQDNRQQAKPAAAGKKERSEGSRSRGRRGGKRSRGGQGRSQTQAGQDGSRNNPNATTASDSNPKADRNGNTAPANADQAPAQANDNQVNGNVATNPAPVKTDNPVPSATVAPVESRPEPPQQETKPTPAPSSTEQPTAHTTPARTDNAQTTSAVDSRPETTVQQNPPSPTPPVPAGGQSTDTSGPTRPETVENKPAPTPAPVSSGSEPRNEQAQPARTEPIQATPAAKPSSPELVQVETQPEHRPTQTAENKPPQTNHETTDIKGS